MKHYDEIIEDSEPEREAMRQKERQERRGLRKHKENGKNPARRTVSADVIEITDDESKSDSATNPPPAAGQILASVQADSGQIPQYKDLYSGTKPSWLRSDESDIQVGGNIQQIPPSCSNPFELSESPREAVGELSALKQSSLPSESTMTANEAQPPLPREFVGPSDSEETGMQARLARFAYPKSTLAPNKIPILRAGTALPSEPENAGLSRRKPNSASGHRFVADFTDAELGKMLKCVGCDIRWTTRKTVAQKMKHIQSCAKKHALSDNTIRILIRKEIGGAVATQSIVHSQINAIHPTFFEEAVLDGNRKKKARKTQVKETVQAAGTTRDYILDRARDVLGGQQETGDLDFPIHTQAFGQSEFGPTKLTQAFGESALAQKQKAKAAAPATSGCEHNGEAPPTPTQPFGPSRLGDVFRSRTPIMDGFWDNPASTILTPIPNESRRSRMEADTNTSPSIKTRLSPHKNSLLFVRAEISARDASRRSPTPGRQMLPPQRSALSPPIHTINTPLAGIISTSSHSQGDEFYESDDTYLHYEPAINHTYPSPPYGRDKPHDEDTPNKLKIQPLGDIHTHKLLTPKFTKTPSRTRKTKSKEAPNVAELDDSWEKRLTETIQEDNNLHLRILRYEPVHFDEFLKLATTTLNLQSSGKLKSKLRLFLDKQAIHFYSAEPIGRRS